MTRSGERCTQAGFVSAVFTTTHIVAGMLTAQTVHLIHRATRDSAYPILGEDTNLMST